MSKFICKDINKNKLQFLKIFINNRFGAIFLGAGSFQETVDIHQRRECISNETNSKPLN